MPLRAPHRQRKGERKDDAVDKGERQSKDDISKDDRRDDRLDANHTTLENRPLISASASAAGAAGGSGCLLDARPSTKAQSVQTLTFLLQSSRHAASQTEAVTTAAPATHHESDPDESDADESETDEQCQSGGAATAIEGASASEGATAEAATPTPPPAIQVRHALISAHTTRMLTSAASRWFAPSLSSRMREQRAYFNRLKYLAIAANKHIENKGQECSRIKSSEEVLARENLDGMAQSLRNIRQVHARMSISLSIVNAVASVRWLLSVASLASPLSVASLASPLSVASLAAPLSVASLASPLSVASLASPLSVASLASPPHCKEMHLCGAGPRCRATSPLMTRSRSSKCRERRHVTSLLHSLARAPALADPGCCTSPWAIFSRISSSSSCTFSSFERPRK
jgi:hypothetical protein